jgi:hypothetical protein
MPKINKIGLTFDVLGYCDWKILEISLAWPGVGRIVLIPT